MYPIMLRGGPQDGCIYDVEFDTEKSWVFDGIEIRGNTYAIVDDYERRPDGTAIRIAQFINVDYWIDE